jgi:sigma-B regulation protein RsbU (phosphoserine phosphatase)
VGGLVLGSLEFPYKSETVYLNRDDLIVFYTDGIPEAMNKNEEEFGQLKFEDLLLVNKNLAVIDLSSVIFDEVKKFCGKSEQSDDITLGVIKITR